MSEKKFICPNCNGSYKKINTVERHAKFGCPNKTDVKFPENKSEEKNVNPVNEMPDFDTLLGNEPEISDETLQTFVDNIELDSDEDGSPRIPISEFINNSNFIESALKSMDEKMNEIYYNKTGKDLWNVSKRDMERNLFVWLLKINIGATGASISPLMALIGFGGYFYAIPAFKIIKIKKGDVNDRRYNGTGNDQNNGTETTE